MQSRARAWLLGASLLFGAPAAHAGMLLSATWTQQIFGTSFSHTAMSTDFGGGSFEVAGISYLAGGVTSISVALELPGFVDTALVPADPSFPLPVFIRATADGGQWIAANPSAASVSMGAIHGMATVHLAMHTAGSMSVPATLLYAFPLDVGVTGRRTGYFSGFLGTHYATVDFYGWTVHTQTFTGLTSRGDALPDVVAKGAWGLSPVNPVHDVFGGAGTVTLVAPTRLAVTGPVPRQTVSLTTLTLNFISDGPYDAIPVPEPSTLLLLAAGALAFGFARRRS